MAPRNLFEIGTTNVVVEVLFAQGTTAFGYGDTVEMAKADVKPSTYKIFGEVAETIVWKRTPKIIKRRKREYQVYAR